MSYRYLPGPSSILPFLFMMHSYNKCNQKISEPDNSDIFYYCFPGLSKYGSLCHRVFTRNGGYSNPPYKSLNLSYSVNDDPLSVDKNLHLIQQKAGADRLLYMNQQHGKRVISIKKGKTKAIDQVFDADALITDIPSLAIMVKQADCQGIIIFDPVKSVVAVVHSGWKGSVLNILGTTVNRMTMDFNCSPEHMLAAIGPSLGPCCAEFKTYKEILPDHFQEYMTEKSHFDFWSISEMQLVNAGLDKERVEKAGICTKCNTDIFYSYRGEGITGRFGTVAMIT